MREETIKCDECGKICGKEVIHVDFDMVSKSFGPLSYSTSIYYGKRPEGVSNDASANEILAASNRKNFLGRHEFCSMECHNNFFDTGNPGN